MAETGAIRTVEELDAVVTYLLREIELLRETERRRMAGWAPHEQEQTKESFDFQWRELPTGAALPGDPQFDEQAFGIVCSHVNEKPPWFEGKRVVDVACGSGRFALALLRLGAMVTAVDQSATALDATRELCVGHEDRLVLLKRDILEWDEELDFDLVFCNGMIHHTGNPYRAIENLVNKARHGGKVFAMCYGVPRNLLEYREIERYEAMRHGLRLLSFEKRLERVRAQVPEASQHGWFDAVSPRVNDLLTFDEYCAALQRCGLRDIVRTNNGRNMYVVGVRE